MSGRGVWSKVWTACFFMVGVEATPLDDLAAVIKERSSSWAEDFVERQKDIQRSLLCLQKMQDNSPWNGAREVLRIYPFLEGIWGTTSPELYLDSEGYACKQGTARVFHGNEEKWSEHNWKNLLRSLERVVTLCQRRGQEARVLINLVHRVRGTSELPPTDQDPLTEAQQLLKCVRLGRSPVIPESFSPETLERLEGERRERQARKSREAVEWSRNFDQTLKELEITIPQEQERRDQIFRANLGFNEAISQCLDEAGRIMAPYAKPVPSEEG